MTDLTYADVHYILLAEYHSKKGAGRLFIGDEAHIRRLESALGEKKSDEKIPKNKFNELFQIITDALNNVNPEKKSGLVFEILDEKFRRSSQFTLNGLLDEEQTPVLSGLFEKKGTVIPERLTSYAIPSYLTIEGDSLSITTYKGSRYPENQAKINRWLKKHFGIEGEGTGSLRFNDPLSQLIMTTIIIDYNYCTILNDDKFDALATFMIARLNNAPLPHTETLSAYFDVFLQQLKNRLALKQLSHARLMKVASRVNLIAEQEETSESESDEEHTELASIYTTQIREIVRASFQLHHRIVGCVHGLVREYNEKAKTATHATETFDLMKKTHPLLVEKVLKNLDLQYKKLKHPGFMQNVLFRVSAVFGDETSTSQLLNQFTKNRYPAIDPTSLIERTEPKWFEGEFDKLKDAVEAILEHTRTVDNFMSLYAQFEAVIRKSKNSPLAQIKVDRKHPEFYSYNSLESPIVAVINSELSEPEKELLIEQLAQAINYQKNSLNIHLPGSIDYKKLSPLDHAAIRCSASIVRILVKSGAYVNPKSREKDSHGMTPLHHAAKAGNVPAMMVLLESNAEVNALDNDGRTPLHLATDPESMTVLISHGAVITQKDNAGNTVLHLLASSKLFHDNGSFTRSPEQLTPKRARLLESMRLLIEIHSADVNAVNNAGYSPLHLACILTRDTSPSDVNFDFVYGRIHALLKFNANPNLVTNPRDPSRCSEEKTNPFPGRTPLLILYDRTNCSNEYSFSPYYYSKENAIKKQFYNIMLLLIKSGANPHCADKEGNTLLHKVTQLNDLNAMRYLLLDTGCTPNSVNTIGHTPLHTVINEACDIDFAPAGKPSIDLLFLFGANPFLKAKRKKSPKLSGCHSYLPVRSEPKEPLDSIEFSKTCTNNYYKLDPMFNAFYNAHIATYFFKKELIDLFVHSAWNQLPANVCREVLKNIIPLESVNYVLKMIQAGRKVLTSGDPNGYRSFRLFAVTADNQTDLTKSQDDQASMRRSNG